jgi:hypothetical protein
MLEQQILGAVIGVVSGPGGIASFLRRNLMGIWQVTAWPERELWSSQSRLRVCLPGPR